MLSKNKVNKINASITYTNTSKTDYICYSFHVSSTAVFPPRCKKKMFKEILQSYELGLGKS